MSDLQQIFGQGGFVTNSVAPATDFAFVPPNKYLCLIEESSMKPTKAGDGHYVEVVLSILEGEFLGRKIWDRINVDNPSTTCAQIGKSQLAALGLALGIPNLTTVQQLVNGTVIAHVKVQNEQNEVRTYSPAGGAQQPAQPMQPVQQMPPQQHPVPMPPGQPVQCAPPQQQPAQTQQYANAPAQPVPQQQYAPPAQPQQLVQPQPGQVPWARTQ